MLKCSHVQNGIFIRKKGGLLLGMQDGAISWNSCQKQTLALSTCEALSDVIQEVLWLRELNIDYRL